MVPPRSKFSESSYYYFIVSVFGAFVYLIRTLAASWQVFMETLGSVERLGCLLVVFVSGLVGLVS